jgi:hypothetical protein
MGIRPVYLDTRFGMFPLPSSIAPLDSHTTLLKILCVIPVPLVRWILVFIAFALSGYFLVANIYPILATVRIVRPNLRGLLNFSFARQAEAKATRLLIVAIAILHAGLALTFKVLFFSYYVVDKIGVDIPLPGGDTPAANATVSLVQRAFSL